MPSTDRRPESGLTRVVSILIVVDLPAPLGPRNPNMVPARTDRSIPSTAAAPPYDFVSDLASMHDMRQRGRAALI